MEKARYNTELCSNLSQPLNNVKPSNFLGSHHIGSSFFVLILIFYFNALKAMQPLWPPKPRESDIAMVRSALTGVRGV